MFDHMETLEIRLANERERLRLATKESEIEIRTVWVSQLEDEIRAERDFLGIEDDLPEMTDEELLAALDL